MNGESNPYEYVSNRPVVAIDPSGLCTYVLFRTLKLPHTGQGPPLPTPGYMLISPVYHQFVFTTNDDCTVKDTYSWGNVANETGWNKNQPEDRTAAAQGLKLRFAWEVGGDDLDPYVEQAYQILDNYGTRHINGIITDNCKTEAARLVTLARALKSGS